MNPSGALLPSGVVVEDAPCPMGCPGPDTPAATGWDRLHGIGGAFRVVACGTCGLLRTNPRPTLDTIGVYYPDSYGPHSAGPGAGADTNSATLWTRLAMALRWDGTADLVPPMPPGDALEVGCASGRFLAKLRRRGWNARGVEPSAAAGALARKGGFDVQVGPLESVPGWDTPFDLICASHTFEHFHRPLENLRRLRAWAKPGAMLTCAVPNAGALLFRRFLGAWYDLDLPRHLYHFTPRTLGALLGKAGWQVTRVKSQRTMNGLMGSLGYWLRDRSAGKSAAGDAFLAFPESKSPLKSTTVPLSFLLTALGQTGRMVIGRAPYDPIDMKPGFIFDLDGTLADTMPAHFAAWTGIARRYGLTFPEARFYQLGGVPTRRIAEILIAEAGLALDADEVTRAKEQAFVDSLQQPGIIRPIGVVVEIARQRRNDGPLAIASGGARSLVHRTLALIEMTDWFRAIVTAEDTTRHKPEPDVFLEAARRLAVAPADCTVYEDTDLGLEAARRAGMAAVDIRKLL